MNSETKLTQVREFCNSVSFDDAAYDLASDIRDFIDGDTDKLPIGSP